jgi:PD-(D/E)XK nuclease superfamily
VRFSAARGGTFERHPKENIFTECFAATLQEDPQLAKEFLIQLCGKKLDQVQISRASIKVETQQRRDGAYLDMVFRLNGRKLVGVENKLFAPQGKAQLRKYLRLGLDRLAFINVRDAKIARNILGSPHSLLETTQ